MKNRRLLLVPAALVAGSVIAYKTCPKFKAKVNEVIDVSKACARFALKAANVASIYVMRDVYGRLNDAK